MLTGENSENKSVDISRGGRITKIHAIVDGLENPVEFLLSRGNEYNSTHVIELLIKINNFESNILGDKSYGSKSISEYITEQNAAYTTSP